MPELRKVVLGLEANLLSEWFAFLKRRATARGFAFSSNLRLALLGDSDVLLNARQFYDSQFLVLCHFSFMVQIITKIFVQSTSHSLEGTLSFSKKIVISHAYVFGHSVTLDLSRLFSTRSGPHLATPLSLGQTWNGWNPRRCRNIFDTIDSSHWSDR